jgi:hypothetical protein
MIGNYEREFICNNGLLIQRWLVAAAIAAAILVSLSCQCEVAHFILGASTHNNYKSPRVNSDILTRRT